MGSAHRESVEELLTEIWDENGHAVGFACGLCEIEDGIQVKARPHLFELRERTTRREIRTRLCERHYNIVESPASHYDILKRVF